METGLRVDVFGSTFIPRVNSDTRSREISIEGQGRNLAESVLLPKYTNIMTQSIIIESCLHGGHGLHFGQSLDLSLKLK